ncbi:MAG: MFS transporter [Elusimicrobia bacterium]|nr:MFS transporter [Elusimicrobiota bacterium]
MKAPLPHASALRGLGRDARLLFLTRSLRLFACGLISVVLVLYLARIGLPAPRIGLLLTMTLAGDAAVSLWITTSADRLGRRRMLILGALLMVLAGAVFGLSRNYRLLLAAAAVGVISPSGKEVGPFASVEQAILAQVVPGRDRTAVFAWYNLAGSVAAAAGALAGGGAVGLLQTLGWPAAESLRAVILVYAALGLLLALLPLRLSGATEPSPRSRSAAEPRRLGLHRSRGVVFTLSSLFALDAFGGGFVVQSIAVYWFHARFGASPATLGAIFFGANILAGASALAAASLARRIGLIRTMVFTHVPSNVLLILVPLMPNLGLATAVLLLRFSISQMDVPTRQSYTMAVVDPDERSAAAGVTGAARAAGAALSPYLAGLLLAVPALFSAPFFLAGGVKIVYDALLYRGFARLRPAQE